MARHEANRWITAHIEDVQGGTLVGRLAILATSPMPRDGVALQSHG